MERSAVSHTNQAQAGNDQKRLMFCSRTPERVCGELLEPTIGVCPPSHAAGAWQSCTAFGQLYSFFADELNTLTFRRGGLPLETRSFLCFFGHVFPLEYVFPHVNCSICYRNVQHIRRFQNCPTNPGCLCATSIKASIFSSGTSPSTSCEGANM